MRRTIPKLRILGGALLLALFAGWLGEDALAQEARGLVKFVPLNGTERLQMTTKKALTKVEVKRAVPADNVRISDVRGDPTAVAITGLTRGTTTLELTDVDNKRETVEIIVQLDVEYLKAQLRRAVPTANVTPIPVTENTVVLTGAVSRAEEVAVLLGVARSFPGYVILDNMRVAGVQQVQLDVVIAQVSRNEFRSMAFNFLVDGQRFFLGSTFGNAVVNPTTVGVGGQFSNFPSLIGTPGTPNGQPTNVLFGVINSTSGLLGFLQALRLEGVSKTLAQPTLTTMSGTPGSFLVGGEQAVPVPAGLGQVGVQFEEFGTRLNYLPLVLGNGKIRLEIEPEVSSLSAANGTVIQGATVPGRVTNRSHVTVEMESGQTIVIGGLIQHDVSGQTNKVPIIGDLPFVGEFFNSKSFTEQEQEVVILVTPHLIDAQDCDQVTKCLPGQETRSPDDFELFLESILEAPRGPRQVFQHGHYVPAFKNGPTSDMIPCAPGCFSGRGGCGVNGTCGTNGTMCGPNGCVPVTVKAAPAPAVAAPAVMGEPRAVTPPASLPLPATLPPTTGGSEKE